MNATNHAAVGALIGLTVKEPLLIIPIALASHFIMDTLPHFGFKPGGIGNALKYKLTYYAQGIDILSLLVLLYLVRGQAFIVFVGMFFAFLPDIVNISRYFLIERKHPNVAYDPLTRFHKKIQWCERPWGLIVDSLVSVVLLVIIYEVTS